ncbi:MAG: preprotein translocase subunit SecG [Rhizobiales bacterium]|nr:preprotein translocase subunit SecG [Hyphomicrobiales bacterium]
MQTVVIVIHLMVVVAMIGLVLLQKSEGGGLGMGGGGGGGFLSSRGTSNVLTRATAILAGVFFVTSLTLSILASMQRRPSSILPGSAPINQPVRPGGAPPIGSGGGGVLDQLQGPSTPAPAAPPSGPQVPQSQ